MKYSMNSLKFKLIFSVMILVFILSTVSGITFVLVKGSVDRLSKMIDVTVSANDLRFLAGTITRGLPVDIESYSLHPSAENKEKVQTTFDSIERELLKLEQEIADTNGLDQLALIRNMFKSIFENFSAITTKINDKSQFSEVNDLIHEVQEGSGLINEAIQQLISIELSEQQVVKAQLSKKINTNGQWLIFTIFMTSISGIFIFYRYLIKKNILRPLYNMQQTMSKIADDASDIRLRVTVENNDEIGNLAEYFNKMSDTIQKFKENLEDLVAQRTSELNEAQAMLVQSGKLSALGEMAGGIAHEINTPLAVIQMRTEQLLENLEDPEGFDKKSALTALNAIDQTGNRIAKIILGLRSFARDGTRDPVVNFSLNKIIEDTFGLCQERFMTNGVRLELIAPENIEIPCRPTELSQVILNMLNNSFDAIHDQSDRWIRVELLSRDSQVDLSVTDCGHGIPIDLQAKIMQPFFTTKPVGKGTGLGLSISKGIIDRLGGHIFVDNESPNTKIVIRLPR